MRTWSRPTAAGPGQEMEYELLDTGIFNDDRYFDVFVEYAKAAPEDILIRITVCNRGPEAAALQVLPTLWFRNTWSWPGGGSKPVLRSLDTAGHRVIHAHHTDPLFQGSVPDCTLACEGEPVLLFTENETNTERIFGTPNQSPYVKDGFDNYVVHGQHDAVNPQQTGTKAAALYSLNVGRRGDGGAQAAPMLRVGPDDGKSLREVLRGDLRGPAAGSGPVLPGRDPAVGHRR